MAKAYINGIIWYRGLEQSIWGYLIFRSDKERKRDKAFAKAEIQGRISIEYQK